MLGHGIGGVFSDSLCRNFSFPGTSICLFLSASRSPAVARAPSLAPVTRYLPRAVTFLSIRANYVRYIHPESLCDQAGLVVAPGHSLVSFVEARAQHGLQLGRLSRRNLCFVSCPAQNHEANRHSHARHIWSHCLVGVGAAIGGPICC